MWVLNLLGYVEGDTIDDLFPGTGSMATAVQERGNQFDWWAT